MLCTLILAGMHGREAQNKHQICAMVAGVISLLSLLPSLQDLQSIRNREVCSQLQKSLTIAPASKGPEDSHQLEIRQEGLLAPGRALLCYWLSARWEIVRLEPAADNTSGWPAGGSRVPFLPARCVYSITSVNLHVALRICCHWKCQLPFLINHRFKAAHTSAKKTLLQVCIQGFHFFAPVKFALSLKTEDVAPEPL